MDRMTRLLDHLRGVPGATVAELARELGATERTVRRDLARAREGGVVLDVRRGRGGGVRLIRDTHLPALRFTEDEALALALALGAVAADPRLSAMARSARLRLGRVLTDRFGERVAALADVRPEEPVSLLGADPVRAEVLLDLCVAVARRHRVELAYRSGSGTPTRRPVDPYEVVRMAGHWYLVGFCGLRRGIRVFRIDRVATVRRTEITVRAPDDLDAPALVAAGVRRSAEDPVICEFAFDVDARRARELAPAYRMELVDRPGGAHGIIRALPHHLPRLARWVLGLDVGVRVIAPAALRDELGRLADRAHALADG
ncbi:putative DNA-binding transcriptional regulator YafY [Naumannella cuiyingiana]|uniref:Putative DNA-binding transcriptional regulator YafY n=1 Tax=Naumannella cuiyingiana TaxID=1347891 RepID=A0A7Z0IKB0_9ACTN|nr:WYL domain-containing protein [Naumannella cuiyingiana]NYI70323.1 putative DNA-binding transcriptional regulator YafY [Naumannella cuiyingiana]